MESSIHEGVIAKGSIPENDHYTGVRKIKRMGFRGKKMNNDVCENYSY